MPLSPTSGFALGALNWVDCNLSFFEPSREEPPPTDRELQALAELAVATRLWLRNRPDFPSHHIERIKSFLTTQVADSYLWHRAVRFPAEFIPICDLLAATRGPDASPQLHALLQVVSYGPLHDVERGLVSQLELGRSLEWAGIQTDSSNLDELSSRCQKSPLPIYGSNDDCYTLTHLIIFATDFGHRLPPLTGGLSDRDYLARILSSYIVRYIAEGNLDLLIELLLSWQYLRLPQTVLTKQAWRFFVGHQSSDGSFTKRIKVADCTEVSPATPPDRTWFSERYHTTLLAVIAGVSPEMQPIPQEVNTFALGEQTGERLLVVTKDRIKSARVPVSAAWQWMREVSAYSEHDSLEHLGYTLLTWWTWKGLASRVNPHLDSPPESLLRRIRAVDLANYYSVTRGSLTLNIITAGLVRRFDAENTNAAAFLEHISSIVAKSDQEDGCEQLAMCEKKAILDALGFEHQPYGCSYKEVICAAERCALGAAQDRVDNLLIRIESLTRYGMRHVDIEAGDAWLKYLLQGLADNALWKYDWAVACRCLRALGYLNLIAGETLLDYMAFFSMHQQSNGAFGYLGPDSQTLLSGATVYRSVTEINLAITVEAVWTIAELATGGEWQLFRSLSEALPMARASPL